MRNIIFLENCSELGAGTRGSSLGYSALKMAALERESALFTDFPVRKVQDLNDAFLSRPVRYPFAKKIDALVEMYGRISDAVSDSIQSNLFPLILSGDHSNAGGTIAGIRMAHPDKRLGVVWIDAHADLHSPYTTPSGNLHGMPLATALALGKPEKPRNHPDEETLTAWGKLCSVGGLQPKILPEDLVFIEIRDLEDEEWSVIRNQKIKNFLPEEVHKKGVAAVARESLAHLANCDLIYVSFDVDSMDPKVSKGTGTPVPGGLSKQMALELLLRFWREPRLAALEITEINPLLDTHNKMAETIIEFMIALTGDAKQF